MMWHEFALVAAAHLAAVASPGPDFAVVTKVSLKHGRRAGIYSALGIANGILLHIFYCLVGFALFIKRTPWLFQSVRYGGAAYLLYIAVKALFGACAGYKSRKSGEVNKHIITEISASRAWRQGFVTNITNPKATLFFLVIFTQVVNIKTSGVVRSLYGAEMVAMTALWFSGIAYLINRPKFRLGYEKYAWAVDGTLSLVLLGLVVKILL
jgi:RhtB (resistance to homoserine/threonine) family protein